MSIDHRAATVRPYRPGDEAAIQELFHGLFDEHRTLQEWRWRFLEAPAGPAVIRVLDYEGRLVGHVATVILWGWLAGRRVRMASTGDAMIVPGARAVGALRRLVDASISEAPALGLQMQMHFPTDRMTRLIARHGFGRLLGRIPQWVRWHTGAALAASAGRSLPQGVASAGLRTVAAMARRPAGVRIADVHRFGPEFDRLAEHAASHAPCSRLRDAAYLQWRWVDQPPRRSRPWRARAAWRQATLAGFVVFGVEQTDRGRVGRIADILASDAGATRTLLADAADHLAADGCELVTCEYLDPRPWSRRALYGAGFLPRGVGPNVMYGPLSDTVGPLPDDLSAWYLTRGDTDLA